jgi:hypothetical protein
MSRQFQLQSSVNYLQDLGPEIIMNMAKQEIQSGLARKKEMLSLAVGAVFQTIARDPQKMLWIDSLSEMAVNNPFFQEELNVHRSEFLDLAEKSYENLSFQVAKGIVDSILHKGTSSGIKILPRTNTTFNY